MILLPDAGALLILAVVLAAGEVGGVLARLLRLPRVTGQILAGIILGVLAVFPEDAVTRLLPVTHFALGLVAVTVGAHLNIRRLRNAGRRIALLVLLESTLTPLVIFAATVFLPGLGPIPALLLATIGIATAPATIVAVVEESRARGAFVKTLIGAVALNNMACIVLFEVAHAISDVQLAESHVAVFGEAMRSVLLQIIGGIVLGGLAAIGMSLAARFAEKKEVLATSGAVTILMTSGLADYLGMSPLLACLFLGFIQGNITRARDKLADQALSTFQPAILAIFFTMAGMHLDFSLIHEAGIAALAYFLARLFGKTAAGYAAMRVAGAPSKIRRNLGLALLPQAGIAIGLIIFVEGDPVFIAHPRVTSLLVAIVLTVVTLNELVGPIATRLALARAGETGKDRSRLLDFLQEENLVTGFQAESKEEAIEKLTDLLVLSHRLPIDRNRFLQSVLRREEEESTCVGEGLFIPHGILEEELPMAGAMALSAEGLHFETPDGRPVHCLVLLGTSEKERTRHLQVLATLARMVKQDPVFQARLFGVKSPAHAAELLHGEESEGFNYYMEDG